MKNYRSVLLPIGAIVIVGAIVAVALLQKPEETVPASPGLAKSTPTAAFAAPRPTVSRASRPTPKPAAKAQEKDETPAWEKQIDAVLESNVSEAQTAQILLNMLPGLPEDGQIEAANHIANLLPDENYASVKPTLLNPNMPEGVLSVFFTDLMNREDEVKLTAFLDIAKIPNHPFQEEAASDLEIYLGDDFGTDWPKWSAALTKFLKDEEADTATP